MRNERGARALLGRIRRREVPFAGLVMGIFIVVLAVLPLFVKDPYYLNILIVMFLMGYLATAWGLVGQSGQLSFGHVAFIAFGAYTTVVLNQTFGITPWVGMWIGGLVAMAAGSIIGFPTLRLRGVYFALATLAFAYILQVFLTNVTDLGPIHLGGAWGLHVVLQNGGDAPQFFQFDSKTPYYFIALAMLLGVVYLNLWLNKRRTGYYWAAIRGDQDAAESLGINAGRYRVKAFLLSCFLTGLGGAFYAQYFFTVDPVRIADVGFSMEIVLTGIVGGWQSVFGPMAGSFIITPLGQVMRANLAARFPGLNLLIYGLILMIFIRYLPNGINEPLMRVLSWFDRRFWRAKSPSDRAKEGK